MVKGYAFDEDGPLDDYGNPFTFNGEFLAQWPQQIEQEMKAAELAERYHRETEAYDRTVCSGPNSHDGLAMPANSYEMGLIGRNARNLRLQIMDEAARAGISREDMQRAIRWAACRPSRPVFE